MEYLLYVNGISGSLKERVGCDCARCLDPKFSANPSVSLLAIDNGVVAQHILFDIGIGGVKKSVIQNPYLHGSKARLDLIALTHWHPDHAGGLRWLVRGWLTSHRDRNLPQIIPPTYCRSTSAAWIKKENFADWDSFFNPIDSGEDSPPATMLPPIPTQLTDVTITPLTVSHRNADMNPDRLDETAYACTGYVIETPTKKAVLMWDVDTQNNWLWEDCPPAVFNLINNADYLFIDCTTWDASGRNDRHFSHLSFTQILDVARYIRPKHLYLTHLGGHFDGPGHVGYGFTDAQWQLEASQVWGELSLPGTVNVPYIGQELPL